MIVKDDLNNNTRVNCAVQISIKTFIELLAKIEEVEGKKL